MNKYDNVEKRMSGNNQSEENFIAYLEKRQYNYHQIGFQKQPTQDEWKRLPYIMRYTPDFVVWQNNVPKFYEVKSAKHGTFLFKHNNHINYLKWRENSGMPVIYTICHYSSIYNYQYAFILVDATKMTKIAEKYDPEYVKDVWGKLIPVSELIKDENNIGYIK